MFDDEDVPKKAENLNRNLESLSIDELEHYITELKDEIVRCEEEIQKKKSVNEAASAFFK